MNVMVIDRTGTLPELASAIEKEGDSVTRAQYLDPKTTKGMQLILTDTQLRNPPLPTITFRESLPLQALAAMGYDTGEPEDDTSKLFTVTKWYNSSGEWNDQTIIGTPLLGLMNNNLSKNIVTGYALHLSNSSPLQDLFLNTKLREVLSTWHHTGFVTFILALLDTKYIILELVTGLPFHGILPLLEGRKEKISSFFLDEQSLMESWCVGIKLTRFPWPHRDAGERVFFRPLSDEAQDHFWSSTITTTGKVCYVDSTTIGYSTGWSPSLSEANRRARRTCKQLPCKEKQYRTDLASQTALMWNSLKLQSLVAPLAGPLSDHDAAGSSTPQAGTQTSQPVAKTGDADPTNSPAASS